MRTKRLGAIAVLGIALIIVGLGVAATPVEVDCIMCDGTGKVPCPSCDDDGWDICAFCDGTGKVLTKFGMLIPGAIIAIIGIVLIPTAFIVSGGLHRGCGRGQGAGLCAPRDERMVIKIFYAGEVA